MFQLTTRMVCTGQNCHSLGAKFPVRMSFMANYAAGKASYFLVTASSFPRTRGKPRAQGRRCRSRSIQWSARLCQMILASVSEQSVAGKPERASFLIGVNEVNVLDRERRVLRGRAFDANNRVVFGVDPDFAFDQVLVLSSRGDFDDVCAALVDGLFPCNRKRVVPGRDARSLACARL